MSNWSSTPIINFLRKDSDAAKQYLDWQSTAYLEDPPPVQIAKKRLGRQLYTVNLSHRNWVWEGQHKPSGLRWRLYASKRGFTVEVESEYSLDEVWRSFVREWNPAYKDKEIGA